MRISIIIATTNRTEENRRLLESIAAQQYNDIEVFFADQNDGDRLNPILALAFSYISFAIANARPE